MTSLHSFRVTRISISSKGTLWSSSTITYIPCSLSPQNTRITQQFKRFRKWFIQKSIQRIPLYFSKDGFIGRLLLKLKKRQVHILQNGICALSGVNCSQRWGREATDCARSSDEPSHRGRPTVDTKEQCTNTSYDKNSIYASLPPLNLCPKTAEEQIIEFMVGLCLMVLQISICGSLTAAHHIRFWNKPHHTVKALSTNHSYLISLVGKICFFPGPKYCNLKAGQLQFPHNGHTSQRKLYGS